MVGVPAKQIGWVCKCGTTLQFEIKKAFCKYCLNEYVLNVNGVVAVKEKYFSVD